MTKKYDEKIEKFLKKEKIGYTKSYTGHKAHFIEDTEKRDTYNVTLKQNSKSATFKYGQSIANSEKGIKPKKSETIYALKSDSEFTESAGNYKGYLDEFGLEDDKNSRKTYKGLKSNNEKYNKIFTQNQREQLNKIYEDY